LLVVFNGLLVLFTGLLYRATAGLFRETAGLRSAADQQSREASIEAAQKSADAARDSANTYIKTERPYVLISEIQPIPLLGIVSSQGSQGKIKNFGRTPAIMRQISSQLRLSKDKSGITLYTVLQGVIVLGGSEDHLFEIPLEEVLNEQRVGMIQTGESQYWLHFSFVYEDISGATHETAGRWKYNYTARTWSGDYEKIT
jgi:hypothetical protein